MKTFSIHDIRDMGPCYDPDRYLPETWRGTALDILHVEECPAKDRLWVVLNQNWIDDLTLRRFAVWCARQIQVRLDKPDPRCVLAVDTAERMAGGEAAPTDRDDIIFGAVCAWNEAFTVGNNAAKLFAAAAEACLADGGDAGEAACSLRGVAPDADRTAVMQIEKLLELLLADVEPA